MASPEQVPNSPAGQGLRLPSLIPSLSKRPEGGEASRQVARKRESLISPTVGRAPDVVFHGLMFLCGVSVVAALAFILFELFRSSHLSIAQFG